MKIFIPFRSLVVALVLVICFAPAAYAQQGGGRSFNLLDMLLLGVIIFLLVRLFRRRAGGRNNHTGGARDEGQQRESQMPPAAPQDRYENARAMWEMLGGEPQQGTPTPQGAQGGFDEAEFLEGAKLLFHRVKESLATGDWDGIAGFIAPDLLAELKQETTPDLEDTSMEVLLLDAKVSDLQKEQKMTRVSVFFDAQLSKGQAGEQRIDERATWEFSCEDGPDALWLLENIRRADH